MLSAYHDGARAQYEPVARYYRRLGLGDLAQGLVLDAQGLVAG
jgi:hypothetical protein